MDDQPPLSTINAFLRYSNVLAFNVGNEVINQESNTNAARQSSRSYESDCSVSLISEQLSSKPLLEISRLT